MTIMFNQTVQQKIKKFDFYRKLPTDLTEPTLSGAVVSIVAFALMILLFMTEFARYVQVSTVSEMFVDINRGGEKLEINIDLEFPNYPCGLISLDAQDVMGSHVINIEGSMKKIRLDPSGKYLVEEDLMKSKKLTDEELRAQWTDKEGCRLVGYILVNKVPGNFHISSHAFHNQIHKILAGDHRKLDLSHRIHQLSFGSNTDLGFIKQIFQEGVLDPIRGSEKLRPDGLSEAVNYEYYIKVVPTTYKTLRNQEYYVHQYTSNTNEYKTDGAPALYFRYDLSPVTVKFTQTQENFFHFIVQLCAIVGGIFTVAGLIDNLLHLSISSLLKKQGAGKLA